MIPPGEVADLQAAFAADPSDVGVGLYNPAKGEIRVGSFDRVTQGQGHQGLADVLGITDNAAWRGFIVRAGGVMLPVSHFNLIDGSLSLKPDHESHVRGKLRQAGLLR